jgi:hypothetical protein
MNNKYSSIPAFQINQKIVNYLFLHYEEYNQLERIEIKSSNDIVTIRYNTRF